MARGVKTTFVCSQCGARRPRWEGRCSECGEWNALEEEVEATRPSRANGAGRSTARGSRVSHARAEPVEIASMPAEGVRQRRVVTGIGELDRVLGGGIVPGSVMLLAGDPGIGKSTLLLQLSDAVARQHGPVLYVSGEESTDQIRMRASRLGLAGRGVMLMPSDDADAVLDTVEQMSPRLVVIDSIQTMTCADAPGAAGSVSQVRESARLLTDRAKTSDIPVILAGHVTKEGNVAGPRVLEHTVDVVLQLDGDPGGLLRMLHGAKNRFGHTNEVGVFEMRAEGMAEVADPSASLLAGRAHRPENAPGSAIATVIEGTRPITAEVQALTAPSGMQSPRRVATGFDTARLNLIVAVLSRRLRLPLASQDVIVSVTGGLRLTETAADLPVALAIASSVLDEPVAPDLAAAGELGLAAELRPVPQAARRAAEAARLGLRGCILPAGDPTENSGIGNDSSVLAARTLSDAIDLAIQSAGGFVAQQQ